MRVEPCSPDSPCWSRVQAVVDELDQRDWVAFAAEWHREDHVLAALAGEEIIGFLRFVVQPVGPDAGAEPVMIRGHDMLEAKILAFGVLPQWRRRGVGTMLQRHAIEMAMERGCHQIRSHSRGGEGANHQLKLALGFAVHPVRRGADRDGVYFVLPLPRS
jgi:GNAT superfamily N-acetyltransferase